MINKKVHTVSFELLHGQFKGIIERYAFFLTRSRQNVEDTSQEIFLRLWQNWPRLSELAESELEDYIYVMTKNYLTNERRAVIRQRKYLGQYTGWSSDYYFHDEVIIKEGFSVYKKAVMQLSPKERVVYLFYEKDFNREQIAGLVQRSYNTVNNQLRTALQNVKMYLNQNLDFNIDRDGRRKLWRLSSSLN
jgi:RNA polymerase sigma-70 factor (ECF subfamily)